MVLASAGKFRADLFYRLNVVSLYIPPLRERPEDIPELINHFLEIYRRRFKRPALDLTTEARRRMETYAWPGNVRELRNCLERAAALSPDNMIDATLFLPVHAPQQLASEGGGPQTSESLPTLYEMERQHILRAFETAGSNRERAAAILGISTRTLYRKLREYETNVQSNELALG